MIAKIVRIATRTPSVLKTLHEDRTAAERREVRAPAIRFGGIVVTPTMNAMTDVMTMLMISAAGTLRTYRTNVIARPITVSQVAQLFGNTNATGTGPHGLRRMISPPSTKPMNRMNRPMPTPIARFSESGTAFMIASRRPTRTSTRMTMPSQTIDAHRARPAQAQRQRQAEGDDAR